MLWGLEIGIATVAATAAAAVVRLPQQSRTQLVIALVVALALACAYGAYELALFAATPLAGRRWQRHPGHH
jgi:xanthine/uracil permease